MTVEEGDTVIACSPATEHRYMEGQVEHCEECQVEVWVTTETREQAGPTAKPVCLNCVADKYSGEVVQVSDFGNEIAEVHGIDPTELFKRVMAIQRKEKEK